MEKLFKEFSPKTLAEWNEKIITDLKGKDYDHLIWESPENIKIPPIFNRESVNRTKGETTHHHADWEIEQSLNIARIFFISEDRVNKWSDNGTLSEDYKYSHENYRYNQRR